MNSINALLIAFITIFQEVDGFEDAMLSEDKLYVVLAVVLVIWFGVVAMLYRNDRKISALERRLSEGNPED